MHAPLAFALPPARPVWPRPSSARSICLALALLAVALLAGCFGIGDDEGPGGDARDPGDGSGSDDAQPEDGRPCHEYDPPRPAPPSEHEADSMADLDCPGQYVITSRGGAQSWDVPEWKVGDWWHYRFMTVSNGLPECNHESIYEVVGSANTQGLPVHQVTRTIQQCNGETVSEFEFNYTKEHATILTDDGFINHEVLFPLRDGKQWTFMFRTGHLSNVSVRYLPQYPHGTQTFEAYHVEMPGTYTSYHKWWSEEVGNFLRSESALETGWYELVEWHGGSIGGLPGVLR